MNHSMKNMKKILIVGPAWVGDMVMAQTLFILLKQQQPNISIDVLAPNWSNPLLERMPEVNQALNLPIGHGKLALLQRYKIAKQLSQQHYQQVIILPNSFKSALVPFFAKIPLRTAWRGEYRYGLINDMRILDKTQLPLMVERFMALALNNNAHLPKPLPRPCLQVNANNVKAALSKFNLDPHSKPILVLCPGAEFGPAKRWPEQHYASIAAQQLKQGWQVWLFGSLKDRPTAAKINHLCNNQCEDLTGKTALAEAIDLLSLSHKVVSNDSGLMHIAAALNRPLVVIYGSSSPKFTPPLNDQKQILQLDLECSPCFKRTCPLQHLDCLVQLQPERVEKALAALDLNTPLAVEKS